MAKTEVASHGMEEHRATYEGFIKGAIALTLISAFTVVALCQFGFGTSISMNFLIGFGGLIAGLIAIIIDVRAKSSKWLLSTGLLIAYGLLVAISIT